MRSTRLSLSHSGSLPLLAASLLPLSGRGGTLDLAGIGLGRFFPVSWLQHKSTRALDENSVVPTLPFRCNCHLRDCGPEEIAKEEEIESPFDFVEASSPRTLPYFAAAGTFTPTALSSSQSRSSFSYQEICCENDLAVLGLQQSCPRQYLVLRTLRASLGGLHHSFESPREIDQSPPKQRQGQGQRSRIKAEGFDGNFGASTKATSTGAYLLDGGEHTGSGHTSKSCWNGCSRRSRYYFIDDIGTQCVDSSRVGQQARVNESARSCRCGDRQDHRQAAERSQDYRGGRQDTKYRHTQQQTSETTESTPETVSAEGRHFEAVEGVQNRDGEIHEPQAHGGNHQTGGDQIRDRTGQTHGRLAPTTDPVSFFDCGSACSYRSRTPWHFARWDYTSGDHSSAGSSHLQPHRHPGDTGFTRGRSARGRRRGTASHGFGQGEARQSEIKNTHRRACDTKYGIETAEAEDTEEAHSKSSHRSSECSFLIRPCPDTGIPERDDHGRSRKVTFSPSPEYITFDPEPDEFGLWHSTFDDLSSFMQTGTSTAVKVWWGGVPHHSEPRQLILQTTTIEMELLSTHFAELWADHLQEADFSFRRLVLPEGCDLEAAVHFLVFPLPREPEIYPTLVGVHSSCHSGSTLTRWFPWCFSGHSLCGDRLLRDLQLQRSSTTKIVLRERTFTLEARLPLLAGDVLEIFEEGEEASLFQDIPISSSPPVPLRELSIGEPLRGDRLLGIEGEEEDIDLTEQPHVGDVHLYGFDTVDDGFLQPRTVVTSEAYLGIPQPERIARDGCVLVLSLKTPQIHSPGFALALCETITMDRYQRERLADVRHFACLLPSPSFTWTWLGAALSAEERGLLDVDGRIVMVHHRPIPNHLPATLDDGCLVTFLVDRRCSSTPATGLCSAG